MATTTTVAAIRAALVTTIEALTPTGLNAYPYRYASHQRIQQALGQSTAGLRMFRIDAPGTPEEAPLQSPTEKRRRELWTLRLFYPQLQSIGGDLGLEGLENAIRTDQEQLWSAIHDADNWAAGVRDQYPLGARIEAGDSSYQSVIEFEVEYLVAR